MTKQKTYKIHEIFYSIQGEGQWVGKPMVFIRFWGCNLECRFCDTPQRDEDMREMTLDAIIKATRRLTVAYPAVCLTGGEPLMQIDEELLQGIKKCSTGIYLETNGTISLREHLAFYFKHIAVSPKGMSTDIGLIEQAHELRFAYTKDREHILEDFRTRFHINPAKVFVSPVNYEKRVHDQNLHDAVEYCLKHPLVRLSVQAHKLWRIR